MEITNAKITLEGNKVVAEGNFTAEFLADFARRLGVTSQTLTVAHGPPPPVRQVEPRPTQPKAEAKAPHQKYSQAGTILSFLKLRPDQHVHINELLGTVPPAKQPSLRVTISRLATRGEILHVGRSLYQAAS